MINSSHFLIRFVAILTIITVFPLHDQITGKLSGRIIDKASGELMLGVNILLEGTAIVVATNKDGEFIMIMFPLVIEYLDYKRKPNEDKKYNFIIE